MISSRSCTVALATMLAMSSVGAQPMAAQTVLYDGGAPTATSGNEFSSYVTAQRFTLSNSSNVSGLRYWAIDLGTGTGYTGTTSWFLYQDSAGLPGTALFFGTQAGSRVSAGLGYGGYPSYQHDLTINASLSAGTYWLALLNGTTGCLCGSQYYWQSAPPTGTLPFAYNFSPFVNSDGTHTVPFLGPYDSDLAFQVIGTVGTDVAVTPEPATLGLVATGLAGLATTRRRRRS